MFLNQKMIFLDKFDLSKHKIMKFTFTNYGFINALWSLIPIFPLWTLFPGIGIETGIEKISGNCELSYEIDLALSIFLIIVATIWYLINTKRLKKKDIRTVKKYFRLLSLFIYTFINTAALIIILGPYLACNGSSMSIMVVIFTAPIASFSIIVLGFLVDLKIKFDARDVYISS